MMAEVSTFRGTLIFFDKLGIYDVILPFLLVFTLMFAILEKTKVLGTETVDGQKVTRKNLNAMLSFVIAFLTVASSSIVRIINETAANIVILLLISVFFLLLVGSFMKEGEGVFLEGGWKVLFMIIMFLGVLLIFLSAIKYEGKSWLRWVYDFLANFNNSNVVSSVVLIIVIVVFMWYVMRDQKSSSAKS
jgi:hypothetical protein